MIRFSQLFFIDVNVRIESEIFKYPCNDALSLQQTVHKQGIQLHISHWLTAEDRCTVHPVMSMAGWDYEAGLC